MSYTFKILNISCKGILSHYSSFIIRNGRSVTPDLEYGYTTGLLMSFFLVLGLVLILDLMFSSANILNALSVVTNLGKDDIGNALARNNQEILTRKVYDGIYKFMDPYVVYE